MDRLERFAKFCDISALLTLSTRLYADSWSVLALTLRGHAVIAIDYSDTTFAQSDSVSE